MMRFIPRDDSFYELSSIRESAVASRKTNYCSRVRISVAAHGTLEMESLYKHTIRRNARH